MDATAPNHMFEASENPLLNLHEMPLIIATDAAIEDHAATGRAE